MGDSAGGCRINLLLELLEAVGLVTSAVERHVSETGDDADDGSAKTPFRTIAHALADAGQLRADRRLVIKLHGSLTETVQLPSHVSLQGPATLTAGAPGPAITVAGTADIVLSDLAISGKSPFVGDGGALLVEFGDRVSLERCELFGSVAGRGGGLAILNSTAVTVRDCKVHDNTAGTLDVTMAGAGILPHITLPTAPGGNGHGGGIYVRDSDAQIIGCDVFENQAILAGGGIAITNDTRPASSVAVINCQVTCNQVSHPSLDPLLATASNPLGATISIRRADIGDPVHVAFHSLVVSAIGLVFSAADEAKLIALLHGLNFESGLGGGIYVRSASAVRIAGCKIGVTRGGAEGANRARRGAGISCYIGAYPTIEDNEIAYNVAGGDGGGIAIDQFDPVLPPGMASTFGITAIPMVPRSPIALSRNEIRHNHALEDGGGVYGTGNVQLVVKGGSVRNNRSAEDGGGLRVTYASNLYAEGVFIGNNQCNVVVADPVKGDSDGGGGVAARNAIVTLRNCELTGNLANQFAGGAVYFVSCWEGGIDSTAGIPYRVSNQHGTFDQTMEAPTAFAFHTRVLHLIDCHGLTNLAQGASGAGGFLYAVRSAKPLGAGILGGGEPMWIDIEGAATSIALNQSDHTNDGGRKRGNVVIELSGTSISGVPADRVWIGPEIAAGAIAPSDSATPDPALDRALVVLVDNDAAHDIGQATWAGTGFSFGPVPTIGSVAPASAPTTGGTALTIAGTAFDDGMTVLVGGAAAPITAHSSTSLTVTSPPGPAGPADLTVIGPSGARATRPAAVMLVAP